MCKDEYEDIIEIYESLKDILQQIVVVVTAKESYLEIFRFCERNDIDCFYLKWTDDYSLPLNCATKLVETEWILRVDCDERIDGENKNRIVKALKYAEENRDVCGFEVKQRGYMVRREMGVKKVLVHKGYEFAVDDITMRLYKNLPQCYWKYNSHESLYDSFRDHNLKYVRTNIVFHHYGKLNMKQKARYYLELQKKRVQMYPDDIQSFFYLGAAHEFCGQIKEANIAFKESVKRFPDYLNGWVGYLLTLIKLNKKQEYERERLRAEGRFGEEEVAHLLDSLIR